MIAGGRRMLTDITAKPAQTPADASTSREPRLDYIDTLRGLASIQVLLSHSMLAFFLSAAFASPSSGKLLGYLAATPLYFAIDGASAVCIFFVLSGYVLTPLFGHSRATSGALVGSRFLRLAIPAIAACGFSAILFQVFGGDNIAAGPTAQSPWLAAGWRPAPDLWFIKDAVVNGMFLGFQDYSLAPWVGIPTSWLSPTANSYVTPLWTLSVEFAGSLLVLLLARSRSWVLTILAAIIFCRTYLLCFLLGHVAARFGLGEKRQLLSWPLAATAATAGLAVCMTSHFWTPRLVVEACALSQQILPSCPTADKASYLMRIYGATLFTVGIMQCAPIRTFLAHKRLRALGRLSFPIYLTHWPIIFGVGSFSLLILAPRIGPLPARFFALAISIALTVIAAMCFEPVDQLALRVSRAWRRRANSPAVTD
jgi:peptidoglycan/LPS O-acetylase OafA/YrhL